jgi:hypothetical protein
VEVSRQWRSVDSGGGGWGRLVVEYSEDLEDVVDVVDVGKVGTLRS